MALARSLLPVIALALLVVAADGAQARDAAIWHATRAVAERDVRERFPNVASVRCRPDRQSSSFVQNGSRLWHRWTCAGRTHPGTTFALVYQATGECKACWRLLELEGADAAELRTRPASTAPPPAAAPPPSPSPPSPPSAASGRAAQLDEPTALCGRAYGRAGLRVRLQAPVDDGAVLLLRDGSVWMPAPSQQTRTESWNRFHTVVLVDGGYGYPCSMVNLNRGERVFARPAVPGACGGTVHVDAGKPMPLRARRQGGELLVLDDASLWEVAPDDRRRTLAWLRAGRPEVVVLHGKGAWPHICMIVNLDRAELVDARRVG